MTLRIGWFTTARGPGSRGMFEYVERAVREGDLDAEFAFVFSNRERGESEATDSFFDLVEGAGIPLVSCSSVAFRRSVGGERSRPDAPLPEWRLAYDRRVAEAIEEHSFDLGVLAGYMLIVERELVTRHALLNLHPALPDGPAGVWQAVIRELIREGADESGVMVHLAIPEVDEGPAVAYCRYPLRDPALEALREALPGPPGDLDDATLDATPLFAAIRARGVEREAPLLAAAIAEFASGALRVAGARVVDATGRPAPPADVTDRVEAQLAAR
ncbi:MAG: phosphoglycerate transporter [Chloroflexi bacterium]|nr:phosphoglycerate transporter [Chloroflexota bacterium]